MRHLASLPLLLLLANCASGYDEASSAQLALAESPDAIGVLRVLGDPRVDFETLDDVVALDRRAARSLIDHRNGPDGFYQTNDDDVFDSIDEVDAQSYVGPSALRKLLAYAEANAYLPAPEDVLGAFDGIVFTLTQAEQTLQLCNAAGELELDDDIGLDRRAVTSILEARPLTSMTELASLYYVGNSALGKLKARIAPTPSTRADCRNSAECPEAQVCQGIPFDGSSEFGKCRPSGYPAGSGVSCTVTEPCGPELFCGGLTMIEDGMCIAAWQQDTFSNTSPRIIPQESGEFIATSVTVRGQATVPFDITVDVELDHNDPHSLTIVLYDPNGTDALLWDGPNEGTAIFPASFVALGHISRDDMVNGRWQLRVFNQQGQGVGSLAGWTLWLSSNFD